MFAAYRPMIQNPINAIRPMMITAGQSGHLGLGSRLGGSARRKIMLRQRKTISVETSARIISPRPIRELAGHDKRELEVGCCFTRPMPASHGRLLINWRL